MLIWDYKELHCGPPVMLAQVSLLKVEIILHGEKSLPKKTIVGKVINGVCLKRILSLNTYVATLCSRRRDLD